jgi:hypothetical protein
MSMIEHPDDTAHEGMSELRARLDAGKRAEHREQVEQSLAGDDIRQQVALGFVDGFTLVTGDQKLMARYWRGGWEQFMAHTTDASHMWIGKRLFAGAVIAIVSAGVLWLVKNGVLK